MKILRCARCLDALDAPLNRVAIVVVVVAALRVVELVVGRANNGRPCVKRVQGQRGRVGALKADLLAQVVDAQRPRVAPPVLQLGAVVAPCPLVRARRLVLMHVVIAA